MMPENAERYDFKELLKLPVGEATDVEEFLGPVQVAWVPGKGRGLVAARDVGLGELLFVNRAFQVAETGKLLEATLRKLEDPRRCSDEEFQSFFRLSSGQGKGPLPEFPELKCRMRRRDSPQPDVPLRSVNRRLVKDILDSNAHELDTSDVAKLQSAGKLSSIFLTASLVNHSCRPTAARVFLGDLMFVRAARDLRMGEEITDGYISVLQPVFERVAGIRKRYGFELHEDRGVVETALLPEPEVRAMLREMDEVESLEEFQALSEKIQRLVHGAILRLPSASAAVQQAAQRLGLGLGLEKLLLGGAGEVPVLVATAALLEHLGRLREAAQAYSRCCWLMEELAPHNAYHAKWALEALLCANRAGLPLAEYVAYAGKVLACHIGPGTLETVLRCQLGEKRSRSLLAGHSAQVRSWPPGEVGILHTLHTHGDPGSVSSMDLEFHLDEKVSPAEVEISVNQMLLYVQVRQKCFYLVLPGKVDGEPEPIRLSMRGPGSVRWPCAAALIMVVQRLWNFVKRHRKKLIASGIIAGGIWYALRVYLPRAQQRMFDELMKALQESGSSSDDSKAQQRSRARFQENQLVSDDYARKGLRSYEPKHAGCFKIDKCQQEVKEAKAKDKKIIAFKALQEECLSLLASAVYSIHVNLLLHRIINNIAGREARGRLSQQGAGATSKANGEEDASSMKELIDSTEYFLKEGPERMAAAARKAVKAAAEAVPLPPESSVNSESLSTFFVDVFNRMDQDVWENQKGASLLPPAQDQEKGSGKQPTFGPMARLGAIDLIVCL
ncbi:SMYD2 [Symbiodinium necroappetens]|uniref:SMYD2 protein n=1 Tax=Symbiodinium necroappetens TaxID=1628268 RepID=A0A813CA76_9DINO|nr:SMYD2 [Symbiodinium necroappetens]